MEAVKPTFKCFGLIRPENRTLVYRLRGERSRPRAIIVHTEYYYYIYFCKFFSNFSHNFCCFRYLLGNFLNVQFKI